MTKHSVLIRAFCICAMLLSVRMGYAQTLSSAAAGGRASTISYQGSLAGPDGQRVPDGKASIQVALWTDAGEGTRVWQDSFETDVRGGIFNLQLGSQTPLPMSIEMDKPLWLGVAINGSAEVRSPLSAVPMALNVADNAITTAKLADNSVTASKLGTDYVGSISINGQKVTGRGSSINITAGDGIDAVYDQASQSLLLKAGDVNTGKGAKTQNANSVVLLTMWSEAGNSNFTGSPILGTTDGTTLTMVTNNTTTLQLIPTAGVSNIIGGDVANIMGAAVQGSIIAGGGNATYPNTMAQGADFSVIGGGDSNRAQSAYDVVGGGGFNVAGDAQYTNDTFAVVSGGYHNWAREEFSNVAGGQANTVMSPRASIVGGGFNAIGDEDLWTADYAAIGGGNFNRIYERNATIAGGDSNLIYHNANYGCIGGGKWNTIAKAASDTNHTIDQWYSAIAGGFTNTIRSSYSVIGGGDTNTIDIGANYSVIGGGRRNILEGPWSVIAGGDSNAIYNLAADHNVIGGGLKNVEQDPSWGTIAGGANNLLDTVAWGAFIGGGWLNDIETPLSTIGGGWGNVIHRVDAASGRWQDAWFPYGGFIGGGKSNQISSGVYSTIGGGDTNSVLATYGFVGGGLQNTVGGGSDTSAIGGGAYNQIQSAKSSFLGGGTNNSILTGSNHSFLGSGNGNTIQSNYVTSVIVGGQSNTISAAGSAAGSSNFMGAGEYNIIDGNGEHHGADPAIASAIVAGQYDTLDEALSFIGAGHHNRSHDDGDFIGAGSWNVLDRGREHAIVAGRGNSIDIAPGVANGIGSAFIGAGDTNTIKGNGTMANIPSGDHLTANEYTQTVVGHYNILPAGNIKDTASAVTHGDNFLFIAGNGVNVGGVTVPSNAATISSNGHVTAWQKLGTAGLPNPTIAGTIYSNNTIVAWGDVPPGTTGIGSGMTDGIGCTVIPLGPPGTYQITLLVTDPSGPHTFVAGQAAIVATPTMTPPGGPAMVTSGALVVPGNWFIVTTFDWATGLPAGTIGFQFHVVTR